MQLLHLMISLHCGPGVIWHVTLRLAEARAEPELEDSDLGDSQSDVETRTGPAMESQVSESSPLAPLGRVLMAA